jgi:hypothetical protein
LRKGHHRAVDEILGFAREIGLLARQFLAEEDDVEIDVPAAELSDCQIAKKVRMQRRRARPIGEGEAMHLPGKDLARVDKLDAVGNAQLHVRGIEQGTGTARDQASQRQLFIRAELRACPEGANFLARQWPLRGFV